MNKMSRSRQGGSAIGTTLFLIIVGYGIFVGIQYVPQLIESSSIDSVLESLESLQREEPFGSVDAIESRLNALLNINEMEKMQDNFKVRRDGNSFLVEVSYERELNLIYENKKMLYEKTKTLK